MGQQDAYAEPNSSEYHPAADELVELNRRVADTVKTPAWRLRPAVTSQS